MFNLVELIADEQEPAPCLHGNIVTAHACYCHADTPETPRKCHIWRWHGTQIEFWRKAKEIDPDEGCPFFEPNPAFPSQRSSE